MQAVPRCFIFSPNNAELAYLPDILRASTPNTNHDKPKLALWGNTSCTFNYNRATDKSNLAKYLIRSKQPVSMAEDDAFTNYIRITRNPDCESNSRNTIRSEVFKYLKNKNKYQLQRYHLCLIKLHSLLIVGVDTLKKDKLPCSFPTGQNDVQLVDIYKRQAATNSTHPEGQSRSSGLADPVKQTAGQMLLIEIELAQY